MAEDMVMDFDGSEDLDYVPELYTLVDEEGAEHSFELMDILEVDGFRYYAMMPTVEGSDGVSAVSAEPAADILDPENTEDELVILKAPIDSADDADLFSIDDDDEFERIGQMFLERLNSDDFE